MVKFTLGLPFIGVYLLVESLQVKLKPSFYLTFFLKERMQNHVYLKKKNKLTGQTICMNSLHCKEVKLV